jgi:hypothetical protein
LVTQAATVTADVSVVVDVETLVGLQDGGARITLANAEEPMPSTALRELLGDPSIPVRFRRLVVDPHDGSLLDLGRDSYRPSAELRRFITARDGQCRMPGCSARAERCDIDHATPWDEGGPTVRGNLGALCRRHHQLKTHGGWQVIRSSADGRCTWRSPSGRIYDYVPESLLPPRRENAPPAMQAQGDVGPIPF